VIGALGGATVNAIFVSHFQDMATGHFIVRRLERAHGMEAVRRAYADLDAAALAASTAQRLLAPPRIEPTASGDPPRIP